MMQNGRISEKRVAGIVVPTYSLPVGSTNLTYYEIATYEINPVLIVVRKLNIFRGDSTKCTYEHIDNFNLACGILQLQELTNNEIKAKLSPYSTATRWLQCQDINTLSNWPKLLAILSSYFPQGKLYTIRRKTSNFGQPEGEKLLDAYIRYREILFACCVHRYPDYLIVNGVNSQSKQDLDLASKGSFLGTDIFDAWSLLDTMRYNNENWYHYSKEKSKVHPIYTSS